MGRLVLPEFSELMARSEEVKRAKECGYLLFGVDHPLVLRQRQCSDETAV